MRKKWVAREVQRSFCTKAYSDEKPSCIKTRTLIIIQEDDKSNAAATKELLGLRINY